MQTLHGNTAGGLEPGFLLCCVGGWPVPHGTRLQQGLSGFGLSTLCGYNLASVPKHTLSTDNVFSQKSWTMSGPALAQSHSSLHICPCGVCSLAKSVRSPQGQH